MRLALAALAAGGLGALCGSCAAPVVIASAALPVAQASTQAFINGELQSARMATVMETWEVIHTALRELGFDIRGEESPEASRGRRAYVMARDPDGPEIKIRLYRISEHVTRITIRVGVFGDQAVSRLLLSRIEGRLPNPPIPGMPDAAVEPSPGDDYGH